MRNREKTQATILNAAKKLIAKDGFSSLGVNKLADASGVDKQLIYRYFGGLDGVIEHIAKDICFWYGPKPDLSGQTTYSGLIAHLVIQYVHRLRSSPMLRKALLWELSEKSDTLDRLDALRSEMFAQWLTGVQRHLPPPDDLDAQATTAILLASMHYLTLMQQTAGRFAGVELKTDQDWQRITRAAETLIRSTFSQHAMIEKPTTKLGRKPDAKRRTRLKKLPSPGTT